MPKLTPKIILEGTRLTHKTDLAFALNEHPRIVGPRRYRYHSPLISAEWCGFTPVPWGRGPINFEPGGEEEARAMAVFEAWTHLIELQPHYSWIIDRFHLSAQAYQLAANGYRLDFGWLEPRLRALDVHVVLCTRRDGTWANAREDRLKVSGKPSQYDDLEAFEHEQELLRRLASESILPVLELDMTDGDVEAACDAIADWMASTGGLWPRLGRVTSESGATSPPPERLATDRLDLVPLEPGDADEMVGVLDDPDLYAFIGGRPPSLVELRARYALQAARHAPDGSQAWHNWVVRLRPAGTAVGFVQATVDDDGRVADIAWLIGVPWQGRGFAVEAVQRIVSWLELRGVQTITAHVHPEHGASAAVAGRAGLEPTDEFEDGERIWRR